MAGQPSIAAGVSVRNPVIEGLRAASVLYIVAFWHLLDYVPALSAWHNAVTLRITVVVLGLFVFLSGYLAGGHALAPGIGGLTDFYVRKFLRIYPLYLLALFLFSQFALADGETLLRAASLASMFQGPAPPTLWFVSMLLLLYLVAPLLMALAQSASGFWMVTTALSVGLAAAGLLLERFDDRLAIYFPAFALGVYVAIARWRPGAIARILAAAFLPVAWVVSLAGGTAAESSLFSIPLAMAGPVAIWVVLAESEFPANRIVTAIGYASYSMYLLHRPIYVLLSDFLAPAAGLERAVAFGVAGIPLVAGLAWGLQKSYDSLLARFRHAMPQR